MVVPDEGNYLNPLSDQINDLTLLSTTVPYRVCRVQISFFENKDYVMSQSQTLVENFEMKHVMEYIHVLMRFDEHCINITYIMVSM